MSNTNKGLFLTDLDGTFLNHRGKIEPYNIALLNFLKQNNIICAICSGRTYDSAYEVVPINTPFDYLIFSSGAGICSFKDKKIIIKHALSPAEIKNVSNFFLNKNIEFCLHFPIPENHNFFWFSDDIHTDDLNSKLYWLKGHAFKGSLSDINKMKEATQLLGITKSGEQYIDELKKLNLNINIVRSTSPISGKYDWIEVFPKGVSKGLSSLWLSKYLDIDISESISVGNDYNDEDMLEVTDSSYIMPTASPDLLNKFKSISKSPRGLAGAVYQWYYEKFNKKIITHRIITGEVNSGKSSYLRHNLQSLMKHEPTDGFVCVKTQSPESSCNFGYDLIHITDGSRCPLIRNNAALPPDWNEYICLNSRFSFCKEGFEFAYNIFDNAVKNNIKHFIIDEVAHLETRGDGFGPMISECLARNIKITTVIRAYLLEKITKLYKINNFDIIKVQR